MWEPRAFAAYQEHYPATPPLPTVPAEALTARFGERWRGSDAAVDEPLAAGLGGVRVVFVRGYLGNYMPGNLVAPVRALSRRGVDARVVRTATGGTIAGNVARLAAAIPDDGTPTVYCGHSKGGLECLRLLDAHPTRARAAVAVVMSQTPRGASRVLESLLLREHQATLGGVHRRVAEATQRLGLHGAGAAAGGHELTAEPLGALIAAIDGVARPYPVWQTASWSIRPTAWLDSFHERLGEVRPGCAHDGQFYLEDLLWPDLPHVLLAELDHAQPAMGGYGFDHCRYWRVLLSLVGEDARAAGA